MFPASPSRDPRLRAMLRLAPVIPAHAPEDIGQAVQTARALLRGGLPVIQINLDAPQAVEAIAAITAEVPDMVVAAGSVLTPDQLDIACQAGARLAVSPVATNALYLAARQTGMPLLPGVATPHAIAQGLALGWDTFAYSPADGTEQLAAWSHAFADVRFCPIGGITPASARQFLRQPNVLCVGGDWLTPRDAIAAGDWLHIERLAAEVAALAG